MSKLLVLAALVTHREFVLAAVARPARTGPNPDRAEGKMELIFRILAFPQEFKKAGHPWLRLPGLRC
jgi:hypothetical protein